MRLSYRGHEIEVQRERCLAGYDLTYFSIVRKSDGFVIEDSFTEGEDSVPEMVEHLIRRVDNEILEAKCDRGAYGYHYYPMDDAR